MAIACPSCEHIHFETNRAARPTHCTACGHDLSEPVVPLAKASPPGARTKSVLGVRGPFFFAGLAVLCLAGWFLLSGVAERGRYVPVMATVSSGYLEGTTPLNSVYVVDGKTYRTTVDRRWRLADRFEVWYHPDAPEVATETRPYGQFLAATGFLIAGLFLIGLSAGIFGAATEPPDERVTLADPTAEEAAAVHAPPSFAAADVRQRR